jgi:hypothetical protein
MDRAEGRSEVGSQLVWEVGLDRRRGKGSSARPLEYASQRTLLKARD